MVTDKFDANHYYGKPVGDSSAEVVGSDSAETGPVKSEVRSRGRENMERVKAGASRLLSRFDSFLTKKREVPPKLKALAANMGGKVVSTGEWVFGTPGSAKDAITNAAVGAYEAAAKKGSEVRQNVESRLESGRKKAGARYEALRGSTAARIDRLQASIETRKVLRRVLIETGVDLDIEPDAEQLEAMRVSEIARLQQEIAGVNRQFDVRQVNREAAVALQQALHAKMQARQQTLPSPAMSEIN